MNLYQSRRAEYVRSRLLYWYSFLMAFPAIVVFFNISIYIFYFLYQSYRDRFRFNLSLKSIEAKLALLFIIGVTISLADIWTLNDGIVRIQRGAAVWYNYAYWSLLIIFMSRHAGNISLIIVRKALFWGLVTSLAYFFIPFLYVLRNLPILKGLQQNILSFLMLCFVPLSLTYVKDRFGSLAFWITGISFSLLAFLSGSRTGSILVTIGFLVMTIYYSRTNLFGWFIAAMIISFIALNQIGFDGIIKRLNSRTYELLYSDGKFIEEDFSYLTRVAILKKGLKLFSLNPYTGIGINSFSSVKAKIDYNFKGAELIAHNDDFFQTASPHNSYLGILSETGLFGFLPFILLILMPLVKLCKNLIFHRHNDVGVALIVGYTCMLVHLYFISGILNVFSWFMIGVVCIYNYQNVVLRR